MITKRMLGIGFAAIGLLTIIGLFAIDFLRAGQYQGIGPAQRIGLIAGGIVLFVGLTLIPLGDRPAYDYIDIADQLT
jgi:hypothetical protein